jgi:YD repeat-containing protein
MVIDGNDDGGIIADRLLTAADSASGTITLDYNNIDRLLSQVTSQGTIAYTYDKVGRQKTMWAPALNEICRSQNEIPIARETNRATNLIRSRRAIPDGPLTLVLYGRS